VQPFPTGRRKNGTMFESRTASNYTSDTDLPKFKLAGLRRVLGSRLTDIQTGFLLGAKLVGN
jgi:hypothetical protein